MNAPLRTRSALAGCTGSELPSDLEELESTLHMIDLELGSKAREREASIRQLERCYHMRSSWEYRLMKAIQRIDELDTHTEMGYESPQDLVCAHFAMGYHRASELVGIALALRQLPHLEAAYASGEISYDHLRALYEIADEDNDAMLADTAKGSSVSQTFRLAKKLKKLSAQDSVDARMRRWCELRWDHDTRMLSLMALLPEEQGALVESVIDSIASKLPSQDPLCEETPMGARRADALVELAAAHASAIQPAALSSDTATEPPAVPSPPASTQTAPSEAPPNAPAPTAPTDSAPTVATDSAPATPTSPAPTAHPTTKVMVRVSLETLLTGQGSAEIQSGPYISAETVKRLMCDSQIQAVVENSDGKPIGFGRSYRSAPPKLKQELITRDGGCCWPSCNRRKLVLEAHHIDEWQADQGRTDYDRMVIFCTYHHWLVHEGGFKVVGLPPKIEIVPPPNGYITFPPVKVAPRRAEPR